MTRQETLEEYKKTEPSPAMIANLERSFVGYDRYYEAKLIYDYLAGKKINALDYGCNCGDYGFYFLENGWTVDFFDYREVIEFVKFRLKEEGYSAGLYTIEQGWQKLPLDKHDLVIFGEVLEHMENPLEILQACISSGVKYIMTSSYPYKSKEEFGMRGHLIEAFDQQNACKELLEKHRRQKFSGALILWIL